MSTTLTLTPIGPHDSTSMRSFLERLSGHDRYMRFLRPMPRITDALVKALTATDGVRHVAVGAFEAGRMVAVARFVSVEEGRAELAFSVDPDCRGRGLARRLIAEVVARAAALDVKELEVFVHPENRPAACLVRALGFTLRYRDGLLEGSLPVAALAEVSC